jgi:hypothetical protein
MRREPRYASDENVHCALSLWTVDYGISSIEVLRHKYGVSFQAPINVVITAAANKLARIAWAVLSSGQDYRAIPDAMTA